MKNKCAILSCKNNKKLQATQIYLQEAINTFCYTEQSTMHEPQASSVDVQIYVQCKEGLHC